MDRAEAGAIAEMIVAELRSVPYEQLVDRLLGNVETRLVDGRAGVAYQVEIHGIWDLGPASDLRVMVGVDDGTFRGAFRPEVRDFVVAPDGSFVGE